MAVNVPIEFYKLFTINTKNQLQLFLYMISYCNYINKNFINTPFLKGLTGKVFLPSGWRCWCHLLTPFYVFWPITDVLVGVEHQICRTRHMMFSLSFAHVVHFAVVLVRMVTNMTVLFVARNYISC